MQSFHSELRALKSPSEQALQLSFYWWQHLIRTGCSTAKVWKNAAVEDNFSFDQTRLRRPVTFTLKLT